jgi:hypothetical protein
MTDLIFRIATASPAHAERAVRRLADLSFAVPAVREIEVAAVPSGTERIEPIAASDPGSLTLTVVVDPLDSGHAGVLLETLRTRLAGTDGVEHVAVELTGRPLLPLNHTTAEDLVRETVW